MKHHKHSSPQSQQMIQIQVKVCQKKKKKHCFFFIYKTFKTLYTFVLFVSIQTTATQQILHPETEMNLYF